ncbi:hypothetical protein O4H49_04460 [Kiloniella laminariae]|uniref:B30.2/SPRY domain-containing protein n=1 Tax=Kiloniella laminariae TaxID=454162 RepID=A0ABT4LJ50_9PROT|nr:SPRY domain-containing protein [Kiloniella laminariae]MCZ4280017.1 hypothetical protein [Kiloniella laminariae]
MSFGAIKTLGKRKYKPDLSNSLALSAGKKLTITPTQTGNRRQFTVMMNVRRTSFGTTQYLLNASNQSQWYFDTSDRLVYNGTASGGNYISTRKFRDTGWMFVGLAVDTVARTIKMVVNDQEIDQWDTATIPTANWVSHFNLAGQSVSIGAYNGGAGTLEANVSDVVLLDGEVLTPAEMIVYRMRYIPHGGGTIAATKKFTTEDIKARFLTFSRNNPGGAEPIINDEGRFISGPSNAWVGAHTEVLPSTGKYQVEFTLLGDGENLVIGTSPASNSGFTGNTVNTLGSFTGAYMRLAGILSYNNTSNGGSYAYPVWGGTSGNEVFSLYLDMDNRKMAMAVDGVFLPNQGGATGTGLYNITSGDVRLFAETYGFTGAKVNFGQNDYVYPVAGYGPLQFPGQSDLKRCNMVEHYGTIICDNVNDRCNQGAGAWYAALSNFVMPTGKFYAEFKCVASSQSTLVGVTSDVVASNMSFPGNQPNSAGIYGHSAGWTDYEFPTGGSQTSKGIPGSVASGSILSTQTIQVAVDVATGKVWYGVNNSWTGNPAAGTGALHTIVPGNMKFAIGLHNHSGIYWNFGDTPFAHTPPTGFVGPARVDFDTLKVAGDTRDLEYGPNGCQLLFENGANLGEVSAGNKVNWTPTGITSADQSEDVPGDPYAVMNALTASNTSMTFTEAGTRVNFNSAYPGTAMGSLGVSSGKWYWEVKLSGGSSGNGHACGIATEAWANKNVDPDGNSTPYSHLVDSRGHYADNGTITNNSTTFAPAVTIGIRLDCDANTISYYKDNVLIGTRAIEAGQRWYPFHKNSTSVASLSQVINHGQKPFVYAPPTGFKKLKGSNLPTPEHHGRDWFNALLHVGTSAIKVLSGAGFAPDLLWGKARSSAYSHRLEDKVRGAGKGLFSNTTWVEETRADSVTSFGSDGVSFGADVGSGFNQNGVSYVDWLFRAGGALVINNDGTIPSMVSAAEAGHFSIATATATGSVGTFGHGLEHVEMVIIKSRNNVGTTGWNVWHKDLSSPVHYLGLESTSAQSSGGSNFSGTWGSLIGGTATLFASGSNLVAYNFRSIPGLCKVGSYTGNGSADGPFVDCGFKPRWLLYKRVDSTSHWTIHDTVRDPVNPARGILEASSSAAESVLTTLDIDLLSNGFTIRTSHQNHNYNGHKYIYLALAEEAGGGDLPWPLAR